MESTATTAPHFLQLLHPRCRLAKTMHRILRSARCCKPYLLGLTQNQQPFVIFDRQFVFVVDFPSHSLPSPHNARAEIGFCGLVPSQPAPSYHCARRDIQIRRLGSSCSTRHEKLGVARYPEPKHGQTSVSELYATVRQSRHKIQPASGPPHQQHAT